MTNASPPSMELETRLHAVDVDDVEVSCRAVWWYEAEGRDRCVYRAFLDSDRRIVSIKRRSLSAHELISWRRQARQDALDEIAG